MRRFVMKAFALQIVFRSKQVLLNIIKVSIDTLSMRKKAPNAGLHTNHSIYKKEIGDLEKMRKVKKRSNTIAAVVSVLLAICMMSMLVINSSASTIVNSNSFDDSGSLTYYLTNGASGYYQLGQFQGALYYNKTSQKMTYDFTIQIPSSMQDSQLKAKILDVGKYNDWSAGVFDSKEENIAYCVENVLAANPNAFPAKYNKTTNWASVYVNESDNFSVTNGSVYYFDLTFSARQTSIACRVDRNIIGLVHYVTGAATARYYIAEQETVQSTSMA